MYTHDVVRIIIIIIVIIISSNSCISMVIMLFCLCDLHGFDY